VSLIVNLGLRVVENVFLKKAKNIADKILDYNYTLVDKKND